MFHDDNLLSSSPSSSIVVVIIHSNGHRAAFLYRRPEAAEMGWACTRLPPTKAYNACMHACMHQPSMATAAAATTAAIPTTASVVAMPPPANGTSSQHLPQQHASTCNSSSNPNPNPNPNLLSHPATNSTICQFYFLRLNLAYILVCLWNELDCCRNVPLTCTS